MYLHIYKVSSPRSMAYCRRRHDTTRNLMCGAVASAWRSGRIKWLVRTGDIQHGGLAHAARDAREHAPVRVAGVADVEPELVNKHSELEFVRHAALGGGEHRAAYGCGCGPHPSPWYALGLSKWIQSSPRLLVLEVLHVLECATCAFVCYMCFHMLHVL